MKKCVSPLTLILTISLLIVSCKKEALQQSNNADTPTFSLTSEHLILGNPSNATSDVANYNNYLMVKPQYVLSYKRDRGIPNWVAGTWTRVG